MINKLIQSIKNDEGFKGYPYSDTKGNLTIGYGTKLPLEPTEAELLLKYRLNKVIEKINNRMPYIQLLQEQIQEVIYEMGYQLGINGLFEFKKMLDCLYEGNYDCMIKEMRNSKWYKQTPNRVEKLIKKIQGAIK